MSVDDFHRYGSMKLFMHQIYEYRKGVRRLVLCTMPPSCAELMRERLDGQGIAHLTQTVGEGKVNLYFGDACCLGVVSTFLHKAMSELTPQEDFMLGAMLGYDIGLQCERFCKRAAV